MRVVLIRSSLVLLLLCGALLSATFATAAPTAVVFSQPDGSGDVSGEGDDYFSRTFAERLDFNNPGDAIWPSGFTNVSMSNGRWRGTSTAGDSHIFVLFPGFNVVAPTIGARQGNGYPIDSSRYSRLIVKYTASARTEIMAYWMATGDPYSGALGNSSAYQVQPGENLIDIDLNFRGPLSGGAAWNSANWGGLRLDLAKFTAGVTVEVDWVRLVPASGGPTFNAQWTCPNCREGFDIFADIDTNPASGMIHLARVDNFAAGSAQVPVGKLGPGNYYLAAVQTGQPVVYSPGTFRVQGAPLVKITSPSTTSGEDYATAVLGRPWDMTGPSSIAGVANITNLSIANGRLQGTATSNDPQVLLLNHNGPAIDTSRYRYLNFDLLVEGPAGGVFNVGRVLWYNDPARFNGTKDLLAWQDFWQNYTFDLRTFPLESAATGWTGAQSVFRIDPHEEGTNGALPGRFSLGPVTLTADPQVAQGGRLPVTWQSSSPNGTVSLFLDVERNNRGVQIASGIPVAQGAHIWSVPDSIAPGTYWLRLVANDGLSETPWYSNAPLNVLPRQTSFRDVPSSDTFYVFIQDLLQRGVVDGTVEGNFQTYRDASRATLARWLVKARGWTPDLTGAPHFWDVPPTHPDYAFIETAYNRGVISGYSAADCGGAPCFRPNNFVTRGQMSKMVVNAMGWPLDTAGGPHFWDVPPSNPFYAQIETIFKRGIVSGYDDGSFRWHLNLTRGQLAKVISNSLAP